MRRQNEDYDEENENPTRVYFYVALGALIAAAAALGCAFIPDIGVYMLIVSVLLELSALSFLSVQKKRNNFKAVRILTVVAYVLCALSAAIFIGGLVYSAMAQK